MIGSELGVSALSLRQRDGPPLLIDFVAGQYQRAGESAATFASLSGVSFTRTGAGTAFTGAGGIQAFATGVPRITDRGLLLEGAATNVLTRSQALDDAAWTKQRCTVTANTATAPDGSTTAERIIPDTGTPGGYRIGQSIALANGSLYTAAFFVAPAGYNFVRLAFLTPTLIGPSAGAYVDFDLTTGAIVTIPTRFGSVTATGLAARVAQAANGFWRIELTITSPGGNFLPALCVLDAPNSETFAPDGASGIHAWQPDLATSSSAGSPIVTTSAVATRGMDIASVTVPAGATTYEAVYGTTNTNVTGTVTPGATFDVVAGRPWIGLGNELKRLVMR